MDKVARSRRRNADGGFALFSSGLVLLIPLRGLLVAEMREDFSACCAHGRRIFTPTRHLFIRAVLRDNAIARCFIEQKSRHVRPGIMSGGVSRRLGQRDHSEVYVSIDNTFFVFW